MADRSVRNPTAPPVRARSPITDPRARPMPRDDAPVATPSRPSAGDVRPGDGRRLVAAFASSLVPGAGQLVNGRLRPALLFAIPAILLAIVAWLIAQSDRPTMILARMIAPTVLGVLLVANVLVLAWRAVAVLHAFTDRRYPRLPGLTGVVGVALVLLVTAIPHVAAWSYGTAAQSMFANIFAGSAARSISSAPPPAATERLNVLLVGVDSGPGRTEALTDSMIVVSLDPVGRTVSMLSVPRDLANVPLGNGNVFGPKINSLMSFADRHPADFPGGGLRALEAAVGALLGIPIHYYARVNLHGFVGMVDAVGGVNITVRKALADPNYGGFGVGPGWSIQPGPHHLSGAEALAYARIRKSAGESDFTRADRQQELLVALRDRAVSAGILFRLPTLLDAVGATVRTDLPPDRLPELAALAEQIGGSATTKVVLGPPQIKSGGTTKYGAIYVPVPDRIRAMVKVLFGPPGTDSTWPVASHAGAGQPGKGSPAP